LARRELHFKPNHLIQLIEHRLTKKKGSSSYAKLKNRRRQEPCGRRLNLPSSTYESIFFFYKTIYEENNLSLVVAGTMISGGRGSFYRADEGSLLGRCLIPYVWD
jgi:hypothetical protein